MANQKKGELVSVKSLFSQDNIVKRFNDLLGNKAPGFISSVLQIVNESNLLSRADPQTVLKNTISKWGIMSIDLTTAISADQSVQRTEGDYQFLDNEQKAIDITGTEQDKERARVLEHIEKATTREQLGQVFDICGDYDLLDEYNAKWDQLPEDKKAK